MGALGVSGRDRLMIALHKAPPLEQLAREGWTSLCRTLPRKQ